MKTKVLNIVKNSKSLLYFQKQNLFTLSKINFQKPILNNQFQQNYLNSIIYQHQIRQFSSSEKQGENEILDQLKKITFEDKTNLVDQKYIIKINIGQNGNVQIMLRLDQNYRKIKQLIQDQLKNILWVKKLDISIAPKDKETEFAQKGGLKNVKKIIAVYSCKGGVGKSTVAINLAFALQKLNKKVGIYDADIYGPSLPTLISKEDVKQLYAPEDNPKSIIPVEFEGLKAMSFGFTGSNRAVMRGPMVSQVVNQLALNTNWGDLDYLVVDFPPGTGDIQITLCQGLEIAGAVIVTTPQRLSFIDVLKGMNMFQDLKVPTICVVENMAYFKCKSCDEKHNLFGDGYLSMIKQQYGIENSYQIPLEPQVSKFSDIGSPAFLTLPENNDIVKIYTNMANQVVEELNQLDAPQNQPPHVRYETGSQLVIVRNQFDGIEKKIKAFDLRINCQCAACVDEFTGQKKIDEKKINPDVYPHKIEQKGRYAVNIAWSDGHQSSIYPFKWLWDNSKILEYKKN